MRLMILEKQRLRNSLRMEGGQVTIGSDTNCNIHLPDPRLGKHQANISQDDAGEWWLEVLDLAVPTCLNRAVQKTRAKLQHADEIECGDFSIKFFFESERSRNDLQHDRMIALLRTHGDTLPLDTIILKENEDMTITRDQLEQMTLLSLRLAQCETVGDMLPPVLRAVARQFDAKRAWIGVRKTEKDEFDWSFGQTPAGKSISRPPFSQVTEARCIKLAHHLCIPQAPHEGVGSAMAVPLVGQSFNLGMLYLENDAGDAAYDLKALIAFKALACSAAMPIDSSMRRAFAIRRAAIATELAIARGTQDALTPKALPQWEDLQVAAYRHLGRAQCCDLYDVVQLRDKTAALLLAKVHWPINALPRTFGEIRAAFRSAALYGEAPHLFARALNWILFDSDKDTYVDLVVARICPTSGKVDLCSAGTRILAAQVRSTGEVERIQLESTPPVGQVRGPVYQGQSYQLGKGESLVLTTDGVETAKNQADQSLGFAGLCETIADGLGDTPGHVLNEFAADLSDFLQGGNHSEDISVLLLRRG
ncbi:MAG TPA: SpoIIE family protein phosphatase [Phycisphaerae bacterium]|nr:SpoIIE family protein phosphatase [Phycisphaerae bacterium]